MGNSQLFPGPTESQEPDGVFRGAEGSVIICICLEVKMLMLYIRNLTKYLTHIPNQNLAYFKIHVVGL